MLKFYDDKNIKKINEFMKNPQNKLFLLIYMNGCGPCEETRPEWLKLYIPNKTIDKKYKNRNDIVLADVEQKNISQLDFVNFEIEGFPTIKYITNKGTTHENYEDSNISLKDRNITSFIDWIKSKTHSKKNNKTKSSHGGRSKRRANNKNKTKKNITRRRYFTKIKYKNIL
jgi:hypothetical protein